MVALAPGLNDILKILIQTNVSKCHEMSGNLKPSGPDKLNEVNVPMNELRALRARINALRRKMVHALSIVRVRRIAGDYCHRWFLATSNHELPPDPQPFIRGMGKAGLWFPSFAAAHNFLNDCRRKNIEPDPERLVRVLLPWSRRYSAPRFEQAAG